MNNSFRNNVLSLVQFHSVAGHSVTEWVQKNEQTKLPLILCEDICGDIAFSFPLHLPTRAHGYHDNVSATPHDFIQAPPTPTPSCL